MDENLRSLFRTMIKSVGVSGTQNGWTDSQRIAFPVVLEQFEEMEEFHHGDCIGVDEQAGNTVWNAGGTKVVTHPPVKNDKRAFSPHHEERVPKDYLVRNADIVNESDLLIFIPKGRKEELRSGTWATYRYAKSKKKPIIVIWPDGDVEADID